MKASAVDEAAVVEAQRLLERPGEAVGPSVIRGSRRP